MSFMQRQVYFGTWICIDGEDGSEEIPADLVNSTLYKLAGAEGFRFDPDALFAACRDYTRNRECHDISVREGWGARLSAPGYMDCTEWTVHDTREEAEKYLAEMYPDEDED